GAAHGDSGERREGALGSYDARSDTPSGPSEALRRCLGVARAGDRSVVGRHARAIRTTGSATAYRARAPGGPPGAAGSHYVTSPGARLVQEWWAHQLYAPEPEAQADLAARIDAVLAEVHNMQAREGFRAAEEMN